MWMVPNGMLTSPISTASHESSQRFCSVNSAKNSNKRLHSDGGEQRSSIKVQWPPLVRLDVICKNE